MFLRHQKRSEGLKVYICDSMMGTGKSSAAINYMNDNKDKRFIYITPYISETNRIAAACKSRRFCRPVPKSEGGKLANLHSLIAAGENIASTHALFARYTPETMDLIKERGYTLIMDEVFCVMEDLKVSRADVRLLFEANYIMLNGDKVVWLKPDYDGASFRKIKDMADQGVLYSHHKKFMFWNFPVEVFESFNEIFVLTYMFKSQMQRYYFDIHGVEYEFIHTALEDGKYVFSDKPGVVVDWSKIRSLVHVLDDEKMNDIGWDPTALCLKWYENATRNQMDRLRKNLRNFLQNKANARVLERMWTAYKDYRGFLLRAGGKDAFLSFNTRATNDYRDRFAVAYLVNVHLTPHFKTYFSFHKAPVDEKKYALSEMIQWVWRSAIRDGKEIYLYVPSRRMRTLFVNWLDKMVLEN